MYASWGFERERDISPNIGGFVKRNRRQHDRRTKDYIPNEILHHLLSLSPLKQLVFSVGEWRIDTKGLDSGVTISSARTLFLVLDYPFELKCPIAR